MLPEILPSMRKIDHKRHQQGDNPFGSALLVSLIGLVNSKAPNKNFFHSIDLLES
jgi:hypothetical protein